MIAQKTPKPQKIQNTGWPGPTTRSLTPVSGRGPAEPRHPGLEAAFLASAGLEDPVLPRLPRGELAEICILIGIPGKARGAPDCCSIQTKRAFQMKMSPARGRFAGIWGPGDNGVLNAGGASPNTDWVPERDGRSASEGRWDGTGARGRRGEGCAGASWPRTHAGRWVPGRPAAGRGSAQVGTRLRFRHRRAQRLRPKRRRRSPPGPGRAAGEGRRHRSRRTEPARPRRGHPPPRPAHPLQRFLPGGFPGEGPPAGAWRGPGSVPRALERGTPKMPF